jgi:hypothetical protein
LREFKLVIEALNRLPMFGSNCSAARTMGVGAPAAKATALPKKKPANTTAKKPSGASDY